jgi:hypothetical protein
MRRFAAVLLLANIASACNDGAGSDDPSCVKEHPRRSSDIEADVLSQAVDNCESDDGTCQAYLQKCKGSVEGRICDADQFISPGAAICIASAAGLPPGLHDLKALIAYDVEYRRVLWHVRNVLHDPGTPPGDAADGTSMAIDAVTGAVLTIDPYVLAP